MSEISEDSAESPPEYEEIFSSHASTSTETLDSPEYEIIELNPRTEERIVSAPATGGPSTSRTNTIIPTLPYEPEVPIILDVEFLEAMPPPYDIAIQGDSTLVKCWLCKGAIYVLNEVDTFVTCGLCGEITPIQDAPAGQKYVRCSCKQLMIVNKSAPKAKCPKEGCGKILNLAQIRSQRQNQHRRGFICYYCHSAFYVSRHHTGAFHVCSHCGRESCTEANYLKKKRLATVMTAIIIGMGGILLLIFSKSSFVCMYFGLPVIMTAMFVLAYAGIFFCAKTSEPIEDSDY